MINIRNTIIGDISKHINCNFGNSLTPRCIKIIGVQKLIDFIDIVLKKFNLFYKDKIGPIK